MEPNQLIEPVSPLPEQSRRMPWVWLILGLLLLLQIFLGFSEYAASLNSVPSEKDLSFQFQNTAKNSPNLLKTMGISKVIEGISSERAGQFPFLDMTARSAMVVLTNQDGLASGWQSSMMDQLVETPQGAVTSPNPDMFVAFAKDQGLIKDNQDKVLAKGLIFAMAKIHADSGEASKASETKPSAGGTKPSPSAKPGTGAIHPSASPPNTPKKPPLASGSNPPAPNTSAAHPGPVTSSKSAPKLTGIDQLPVDANGFPAAPTAAQIKSLQVQLKGLHPANFNQEFALASIQQTLYGSKGAVNQLLGSPKSIVTMIIPLVLFGSSILGGFILLMTYMYLRGHNALPEYLHPAEAKTGFDADRLGIQAVILIGIYFVLGLSATVLLATGLVGTDREPFNLLFNGGLELAIAGLAVLSFKLKLFGIRLPLKSMGLTWERFKKTVFWGIGGCMVAQFLAFGATFVSSIFIHAKAAEHPITKALNLTSHNGFAVVAALAMASIGAPIFEELMFRGTFLPGLKKLFGNSPSSLFYAIAATSMIFGMGHPTGPESWLSLAMVGVVHCILIYQTRSVWPAIISHCCFNGCSLIISVVLANHGIPIG